MQANWPVDPPDQNRRHSDGCHWTVELRIQEAAVHSIDGQNPGKDLNK
jgi:hypothetical protein